MRGTQRWELILNRAMQRNHINRGEDAMGLSRLLPPNPPSLFEWVSLAMLTNSDKWQNTRHLRIVPGLAVGIWHSDLPLRGTHILLSFSFTSIYPLLSCLQHTQVLSGDSDGRECACNAGDKGWEIDPLGWEDPLEEEMVTQSSILTWRITWTEELGGLQSIGSQSQILLSNSHSSTRCYSGWCWEYLLPRAILTITRKIWKVLLLPGLCILVPSQCLLPILVDYCRLANSPKFGGIKTMEAF